MNLMAKPKFELTAELKSGKAVIRVVGHISDEGDVNAASFEKEVDALIEAGHTDVDVYVRTKGGSVFEAAEIINQIQRFTGKKTGTTGALVASSGSAITSSLDYVRAPRNLAFIVHRPKSGNIGNADDLTSTAKLLGDTEKIFLAGYAKKTGNTQKSISASWNADWWMTAEEALEAGFIDEIMDAPEALSAEEVVDIKASYTGNIPEPIAALLPLKKIEKKIENKDVMKKLPLIIGMLNSAGFEVEASADEDAVIAKVQSVTNEVVQLRSENETLKATAKTEADVSAKAMVKSAHEAGKIAADMVATYEGFALKDPVGTQKMLDSIKAPEGVAGRMNLGGGKAPEGKSYGQLMKEDPSALAKLEKKDPEAFKTLKEEYLTSLREG